MTDATPQWFHGIEHLHIEPDGYVYWKGTRVEYYDPDWAHTPEARRDAIELADRCRHIEALELVPDEGNVIWYWSRYQEAKEGGAHGLH